MTRIPKFPFEPRSTAFVRPGDFWAIPTRRGGWYCSGRVLATGTLDGAPTRTIAIGLLNWCEPVHPTSQSIAGASVLVCGHAHIKTIRETGGVLIGHRPLEDDGGLGALVGPDGIADINTWGYKSIEDYAHQYFGRHFPDELAIASERPAHLGME